MLAEFSAVRWERAYRRVAGTAFLRVPFYRDQWVAAGQALNEPEPTRSAALAGQLHRLCPFARPYDPSREPSPWIGDGRDLRAALAMVAVPRRVPVLEVRAAVLDRRALGWNGPRYGVVLAPDANVVDDGRRRKLNLAALALAADAGQAILVGERSALDAVLPEFGGIRVITVERMTAARAVQEQGVAYDPHLGYFAATVHGCGKTHLLWRRFHARPAGGMLAVTALRRTRPVLLDVVPDGGDTLTTAACPRHGTPIIEMR
ncbi:hypothetical protein [Nonomuraea sp. B19D2]|uniref:hypothetical protein n=1 Tax=Nonomuraea sp. B19D2 TaxID=3159561 RepID=UPI0032DBA788